MPQLNVTTVSSTGTIKSTGVMQAGTGFRLPSFTNANRPASPNTGTVIWNSTEGTIQVWNGTSYIAVASSGTLNDWARFDINNRTKFDASISSGLAIMACNKNRYAPINKVVRNNIKLGFKRYDNTGSVSKIIDR